MLKNTNSANGKYQKTIAVVSRPGDDAKILTKLNEKIVKIGSDSFGFRYDSDHPNAIYIVHEDLVTAQNIAYCYGADIAVRIEPGEVFAALITEDSQNSKWERCPEDLNDVAKDVLQKAVNWQGDKGPGSAKPRLENTNPPSPKNNSKLTLSQEITNSLTANKEFRTQKITDIFGSDMVDSGIELLILGGAGPYASADFTAKFVKKLKEQKRSENFIHLSLNQCPGKSRHISGNAPPFQQYYIDTVDFANRVKVRQIVTPGNTNHIVLDEWSKLFNGKILDYRNALLSELQKDGAKEILILGTRSTTFDHKLYHKIIEEAGIKVETVDEKGRDGIAKAISQIKAGKFLESKKSINKIIEDHRSGYGKNITAVLACTELPLVYSKQELTDGDFICVSMAAINYFKRDC